MKDILFDSDSQKVAPLKCIFGLPNCNKTKIKCEHFLKKMQIMWAWLSRDDNRRGKMLLLNGSKRVKEYLYVFGEKVIRSDAFYGGWILGTK